MSEIGRKKQELDTPVLWTDLDQLERNIARLAAYFDKAGVRWRPHTKGIKVPAIAHKALAAGAIGVTCAKLSEAEVMAQAGIRDILIANQVVGPLKTTRLANLRRQADVKVAVDNPANVVELGDAARSKDVELGVLVEVDIGMGRAGVPPGRKTLDLCRAVHETPGLRFEGLMGWEGQTRAIQDLELRRTEIEISVALLNEARRLCEAERLPVRIVSAGGTGTFHVTAFQEGVTEIQAGGAIFCDIACQSWGAAETEPSLFVRTTVTSRPAPDRVILDAGFKALPMWHRQPWSPDLAGVKSIHMSAEHGTLNLETPDSALSVGDAVDFIVGYGDETVVLYDRLYGVREGIVEVDWPIVGRGALT